MEDINTQGQGFWKRFRSFFLVSLAGGSAIGQATLEGLVDGQEKLLEASGRYGQITKDDAKNLSSAAKAKEGKSFLQSAVRNALTFDSIKYDDLDASEKLLVDAEALVFFKYDSKATSVTDEHREKAIGSLIADLVDARNKAKTP